MIDVRHPEEILRETKRDLYFVEFLFKGKIWSFFREHDKLSPIGEVEDKNNPPGRQEVLDWLAENLPGTQWEILGPRERSGLLAGGIYGRIAIHFDPDGLKKFCDRWEVNNKSVDPRFQLGVLPYADFAAKYH